MNNSSLLSPVKAERMISIIEEDEYIEFERNFGFDAVSEEDRDNDDFSTLQWVERRLEMLARMNLVELRRELEDVIKNSKSKQKERGGS